MEIDLTKCTANEYADWFFKEIKPYGGVAIFPNGYITSDMLHKLTEAYRIIGQREGYKKGKKDGSGSTFNHFFRQVFPCGICRYRKICTPEHISKCDVWLRWVGIKQ